MPPCHQLYRPLFLFLLLSIPLVSSSHAHTCTLRDNPTASAVTLPAAHLNDNYCDCLDGTDETQTSACPNGIFKCKQVQKPQTIPASRVADGYCDCCDGSDEPASRCPNVCEALYNAAKRRAHARADIVRRGVATRQKYASQAAKSADEEARNLAKLEKELVDIKKSLKISQERALSLHRRKDWQDSIIHTSDVKDTHDKEEHDSKNDPPSTIDQASSKDDPSDKEMEEEFAEPLGEDGDGDDDDDDDDDDDHYTDGDSHGEAIISGEDHVQSTEDKSQLTAKGDADRVEGKQEEGVENELNSKASTSDPSTSGTSTPESKAESVQLSDMEDANVDVVCADLKAYGSNAITQRLTFLRAVVMFKLHRLLPKVFQEKLSPKKDLNDCVQKADSAKWNLEKKESELVEKIANLKEKSTIDYGADRAMRKLHGTCTKTKVTQYEFELCPYDRVRQYEHGSEIAMLGTYKSLEGGEEDRVMTFTGGDKCWNGPSRSTKVTMSCGETEEIVSVDEPNRCTYAIKFKTPAVCRKELVDAIMADLESEQSENKEEL